jgi:hypothetical protein
MKGSVKSFSLKSTYTHSHFWVAEQEFEVHFSIRLLHSPVAVISNRKVCVVFRLEITDWKSVVWNQCTTSNGNISINLNPPEMVLVTTKLVNSTLIILYSTSWQNPLFFELHRFFWFLGVSKSDWDLPESGADWFMIKKRAKKVDNFAKN